MDKREACYKLADINEQLYELQNRLEEVESRLRWDDERRRDWYLERKAYLEAEIKRYTAEHDAFLSEYYDIIHS